MQQPPTIRASLAATARASALLYPALTLPAILLLVISALATHDSGLFIAALALLIASSVAGIFTGLLVRVLRPTQQSNVGAWLAWVVSLGSPLALVWSVGSGLETLWAKSPALNDVSMPIEGLVFALCLTGIVFGLFLAADTRGDEKAPVVVRHRRVASNWTPYAFAAVVAIAVVANLLTRQGLFARGTGSELRARIPQLQREAARYPKHFRSQYRLGNAFARLDDCIAALGPLQRALAISPNDSFARNDASWAVSCTRVRRQGMGPYAAGTALASSTARTRYGNAAALEQLRNWAGAETEYNRILQRWPNDPIALVRRGVVRYNMGHRGDGLEDVRQALALSDTAYVVQLSSAEVFSEAALLRDALKEYRALAGRDSANAWIWAQYGSTAYLVGELAEASRAFDSAYSLTPEAFLLNNAWRAMRDASHQGIPPSALPPIPPSTGRPVLRGGAPPNR